MQNLIDIIIPNYNYGKYIVESIESVLNQTILPGRILVIDDASSDNSVDVVKNKYSQEIVHSNDLGDIYNAKVKASNVVTISLKKNVGVSEARNIGIGFLTSNSCPYFLGFLDSDDIYFKDKIKESLSIFNSFPGIGMVYSDYVTRNEMTNREEREYKEPFSMERLLQDNIVCGNSIIKTQVFKDVGLFDKNLTVAEDLDMWLRIAEKHMIYRIPEALWMYRNHGLGTTHTVNDRVWSGSYKAIWKKWKERNQIE